MYQSSTQLNHPKHVKYWLRCLRTLLPTEYTSNDSNRMVLAFFILSALDVLGVLQTHVKSEERQRYIQWIYDSQHHLGGFRGSPLPRTLPSTSETRERLEPATLPSTYFALASLAILRDDLDRVNKLPSLDWLARLQRDDGSFGEMLTGPDGGVDEARDVRYCYWATGIRWILRDPGHDSARDIDVDALVGYIKSSETYDHGFSESPFHEAHAGHCYCAISALSFLGRLPSSDSDVKSETGPGAAKLEVPSGNVVSSISSLEGTVRWLVFRQLVEESEEDEDEQTSTNMPLSDVAPPPFNPTPPINQFGEDSHAAFSPPAGSAGSHHASDSTMPGPSHTFVSKDSQSGYGFDSPMSRDPCTSQHGVNLVAGFNGRCNKSSDTCYSFWVCGALAILDRLPLVRIDANRRFLLERTQHFVGGFGKLPGDPPDILHSYTGLAALSLTRESGLKELDPTACVTCETKRHIESVRKNF